VAEGIGASFKGGDAKVQFTTLARGLRSITWVS